MCMSLLLNGATLRKNVKQTRDETVPLNASDVTLLTCLELASSHVGRNA